MVERRTLTPLILVRVQVPQPNFSQLSQRSFRLYRRRLGVNAYVRARAPDSIANESAEPSRLSIRKARIPLPDFILCGYISRFSALPYVDQRYSLNRGSRLNMLPNGNGGVDREWEMRGAESECLRGFRKPRLGDVRHAKEKARTSIHQQSAHDVCSSGGVGDRMFSRLHSTPQRQSCAGLH